MGLNSQQRVSSRLLLRRGHSDNHIREAFAKQWKIVHKEVPGQSNCAQMAPHGHARATNGGTWVAKRGSTSGEGDVNNSGGRVIHVLGPPMEPMTIDRNRNFALRSMSRSTKLDRSLSDFENVQVY